MKNRNKYLNDGIVLLNKSKGITSFNAINKLKWLLNANKTGHAGTLDPMAEGLLVVMINGATKFSEDLMKKDKEYYVEMELGYETDTYDSEGEIIKKFDKSIDMKPEEIKKTVKSFIGDIEQIPPMFSAIKINGEKLYNLARKGIEVERKKRKVKIYYIHNIEYDKKALKMSFIVGVSSGTYIRSLVCDIGEKLGVYATMTRLIRTKISDYNLKDAIKVEDMAEFLEKNKDKDLSAEEIDRVLKIRDIESLLPYESIFINKDKYKKLKNGITVLMDCLKLKNIKSFRLNGIYKIYTKNNEKNEEKVFSGIVKIVKIADNKIYLKRDKYFL